MTQELTAEVLEQWGDTWFGDPRTWPPALVGAAEQCLALGEPAAVAWGPDCRLFYNEAYADLLESQHPGVRGRPAWEAVPAMWSVLGPFLQRVRDTGATQRGERVALSRDTPRGVRLHWYSWIYTPIWSDGRIEGVFAVVHDDTAVEIAERHDEALQAARGLRSVTDVSAAFRQLVSVLGSMPDVRFAVGHQWDAAGRWVRVAHAGPELRPPTAASLLDNAEATRRWPLPPLDPGAGSRLVRPPERTGRGLADSWSVGTPGRASVLALTVGFSPMVGDEADHRRFVDEVVQQIATDRA